ncbi:MAG TPA: YqgE/AlgH family protein, partial [Acidimicrobiales bacterium]|nr:YqgE/AlgH family protein [Acidimicrobiales bacterium]
MAPGGAEGGGPGAPVRGRLLVASTKLGDPNFDRTVVLVLDHGEEGALGVVLNRPTPVPVGEILDTWAAQASLVPPAVIFRGGPVSPDAV